MGLRARFIAEVVTQLSNSSFDAFPIGTYLRGSDPLERKRVGCEPSETWVHSAIVSIETVGGIEQLEVIEAISSNLIVAFS